MHIDTGSSDLWVETASSTLCKHKGNPCGESGTYNANKSSTYKYLSSDFNISYVDGSFATGDYVTDTISIGGASLNNFQFGIGYDTTSEEGVLGIGYTLNEVQVNENGKAAYPNLPVAMTNAGLISSPAFSLWLNDLDSSTGQILFGGINTDKYVGKLATVPIDTRQGASAPAEFIITLTGVGLTDDRGTSMSITADGFATAVLLDSGSSFTYLPTDIVNELYHQTQATFDESSGSAFVPCSLQQDNATIDFTFSGMTISVGLDEMVVDVSADNGGPFNAPDGTPMCFFGVSDAGGGTNVLGDTFLRSAYVVYDLSNNEISLAQTQFNSTQDNVLEITTGKNSVPDATGVANPITVAPTVTGGRISQPTANPKKSAATRAGSRDTISVSVAIAGLVGFVAFFGIY
jgi:hypothetical protein